MKIVNISAEIAPFSKTGGLGEVAKSLPVALRQLGQEIISITPLHHTIERALLEPGGAFSVVIDGKTIEFAYWKKETNGGAVYFIEHKKYFTDPDSIYLTGFDNERFYVFGVAALELLKKIMFSPDVVQCHDWHTGLVPYLLKYRYSKDPFFESVASVFTIHNLAFQFETNWWEADESCRDDGSKNLPPLGDRHMHCVNFALRAIMTADVINTVSESYAKEILTKEFGENLEIMLRTRRSDIYGIINGVDYEAYNPATDPGLKAQYNFDDIEKKKINKVELQRVAGLPQDKDIPVIGMVSRITEQKGVDLILKILDDVLDDRVQVVIMGMGDKEYENIFTSIYKEKYQNFSFLPFEKNKETLVYAGSDLYLMPSRFEPCGLGQLIGLRYGAIPIVRRVGGLADTIDNYDPESDQGIGFVFRKYEPIYLFGAIIRGLVNYKHKQSWERLVQRAMRLSFSWELPAEKYLRLFEYAIDNKRSKKVRLPI
jgi:starch synthase